MHHTLPKKVNDRGNKSPVEDEEIRIIGTTPVISTSFSIICINIVIPQTHRSSEIKQNQNWQYHGQHNSSYYQPQPATDSSYYQPKSGTYNQHQ